jgi:5-methylthioadenosine/S-adenosylhomocysteine deaminase
MTRTTCIRCADWVVAWDAKAARHKYLRGADVAFSGDKIVHVGARFAGKADREIDGRFLMVMPGLINVHTHTATMPLFKGVREELGNPRFYMSALYDGWNLFYTEMTDRHWNARFAYCEMLRCGTTTVVDMCYPFPGWVDAIGESGLRGYVAPLYQSARWHTENGYRLDYIWADDKGAAAMKTAMDTIDQAEGHNSGRLLGLVSPMAVDTCTPELIRDSLQEARRRKRPYQLHAGEAMMEFLEVTRRYGQSQIQWLADKGLLGPEVIIGHGIFLDHHSWLHWATRDDVRILAENGCSVSHCPVVFSRYGITLEDFGAYQKAGVNMTIGTDTHPHNMLEEMRAAATFGRVAAENMFALKTSDIFHAATSNAAKALGRDDIGMLAPGKKADIVLVDLSDPAMQPVYDPIRCLLYTAADRAVRDVFVDGEQRVENRRIKTLDFDQVAREVSRAQRAVMARVPERHHAKWTAEQVAPLTLPVESV